MPAKVAFLSDVHGNSPALQAVKEAIEREGCAQVFVLGDIINGIDPHGCVAALRSWSTATGAEIACVKGNAEMYLVTPDREAVPRQDIDWNAEVIELVQWFEEQLSASDLAWIRSLAETLRWNGVYLVHDSPLDRIEAQTQFDPEIPPQYREWFYHGPGIVPDMPESKWQALLAWMETENIQQVFCGHTHLPFQRMIGNKLVCNTGSVGAPLDGDPRSAWVLWETDNSGTSRVTIRRETYAIKTMLQLIDETPNYPNFKMPGFREAYKKWFLTGIHWREHLSTNG